MTHADKLSEWEASLPRMPGFWLLDQDSQPDYCESSMNYDVSPTDIRDWYIFGDAEGRGLVDHILDVRRAQCEREIKEMCFGTEAVRLFESFKL